MWSLLGAAFWPLLRGVSWDSLKVDLGLHTGQGVATEMTVGLLAFMAERPVLYLLNIFIEMIKTLGSGDSEAPEVEGTGAFPMFESPIGNSWLLVWLGALGSVVWAPVVEELVLRGCLYRALTTWMRWPLAVLLSSICFAIIHPYSADGMASVFVGGVTFAILREWRGSLIACITAHALHNGSIELLNFGYVSLLSK